MLAQRTCWNSSVCRALTIFFLIYCRIKEDVNVKGSGALYKTSVGVSDIRDLRDLKQLLRRRRRVTLLEC